MKVPTLLSIPSSPRGLLALLSLLLLTCHPAKEEPDSAALAAAPPPSATASLLPASGDSRPAVTGPDDTRLFELETGEVLQVEVQEDHLDVIVELYSPSGQRILAFDSPTGGHGLEKICFVAEDPGIYRVTVRYPESSEGKFRFTRKEIMAADSRDRECWQATQLFSTAENRLKNEGTALIPRYREAARLWRRANCPYREAIASIRLGGLLFARGELKEEANSYQRASELFGLLGNRPYEEATSLRLLADARWRQGRVTVAEELLEKALATAHQAGETEAEVAARNTLALLQTSRGEAHLAARELKKNLDIWQREGRPDKEAESLHFLGQIYAEELSKFPEAIDFLDRALEIWRRTGRTEELANTLILRGWASYRAGSPEAAVGFFEEALHLSESAGHQPAVAAALDRLGTTYRALGSLEKAREAFERSLDLSRSSGNLRNQAQTEGNLGLLLLAAGESVAGRAHLEQSLKLLRPFGDRDAVAHVLVGLATAERAQGDLPAALRRYQEAIVLLDSLRLSAREQGGRLSPDPIWQEYYEGYIDLLIESSSLGGGVKALALAFETAELNRSRNLYEILLEAGIEVREGADPGLLSRERDLIAQINSVPSQEGPNADGSGARKMRALSLALETVRDDIRLSNPKFLEIRDPPKVNLTEIQSLLGPDTHLLSIVLGQRRSFLFKVSPTSIEYHVLGSREEIEERARTVYAGLQHRRSPGVSQVRLAARALSKELLDTLNFPPADSRLVIVTDGTLAYIPFAVLPRPGQPENLLIDSYEIIQIPSAAILLPLIRRSASRSRPSRGLAVFAGPVFSPEDSRFGHLDSLRSTSDTSGRLGLIPHAMTEAQAILDLFPPQERFAALGFDARLDLLRSGRLRDYRILHFATHAVVDEAHPERSRLVLSHFDRQGRALRGDLSLAELYTLDLPADLVVLSACRTALGQPVRGNGLVGLTHGFFYAGANRLVVSLWDVHDKATAELMTSFHRLLSQGDLPPGEALRRAQIELRQNPQYALPYFWAGFTLQGDWNPLPNKSLPDGN